MYGNVDVWSCLGIKRGTINYVVNSFRLSYMAILDFVFNIKVYRQDFWNYTTTTPGKHKFVYFF